MSSKKYLLVDFGESGILYTVVTGKPAVSINSLTRSISTGSALQLNNKSINYIFHVQEIVNTINEKIEDHNIDEVTLNLPSLYDNLVLLQKDTKASTLLSEIVKSDENYVTDDLIIYGPAKSADSGSIILTASIVKKGYQDILDGIHEGIKVNLTTSFTRLQFLADKKVKQKEVDDNFIIMDTGYTKTRIITFDKNAVPTGTIQCGLCGRDIIERMKNNNAIDADNDFTNRLNLTDDVKSYVNTTVNITCKQLKAKTGNKPCKIYIYGGLSTLPWEKACKGYEIIKEVCEPLKEKNTIIAVKAALMYETSAASCKIASKVVLKVKNADTKRRRAVELDEQDEDSYIESVKDSEKNSKMLSIKVKQRIKKSDQKPRPIYREDVEEEGEKAEDYDDSVEDDDYEEETIPTKRVDRIPKKKVPDKKPKKIEKKPKQKVKPEKKKKVVRATDEDDSDFLEDDDDYLDEADTRRYNPKSAILLVLCLILVSIGCFVTFGMFMDYRSNAKQTEIVVTNQKASLVAYVQKAIESRSIKISSFKSEIINEQEFLYIGINDIAQETLDDLLLGLGESCDIVQKDIVHGAENTVSLALSVTFK